MTKKSIYIDLILGISIIFIFLGLSYYSPPFFETINRHLLSLNIQFTPSSLVTADNKVVLIEMDDKSLWQWGGSPWSRPMIMELLNKLSAHGIKTIALNLPLVGAERSQGLQEAKAFHEKIKIYPFSDEKNRLWILENINQLEETLDHDRQLVEGIQQGKNIILPFYAKNQNIPSSILDSEELFIRDNMLSANRLSPAFVAHIPEVPQLALPFPGLIQKTGGLGYGEAFMGKWGLGSHPLLIRYRNAFLPSFPLRVAIAYYDQTPAQVFITEDGIRIGNRLVPIYQGQILMRRPNATAPFPTYSCSDVLAEPFNFEPLKDKIALIGINLYGMRPVLRSSLKEINANIWMGRVINSIIQDELYQRPGFLIFIEMLVLALIGLISAFFFPRVSAPSRLVWMLSLSLLVIGLSYGLLLTAHLWFKPAVILAFILVAYMAISFRQFFSFDKKYQESVETSRLLGLSLQSQGHLDLAFEKFKKLPFDDDTKDLLYKIGLEYEQKRLADQALTVYEYIQNRELKYKDIAERIVKLKQSEISSTIGSHSGMVETSIFQDAPLQERTMVGRYKILNVLGRGSMGLVYKALDPKINRILAIKTIRFSDEFEEEVIQEIKERFFREAEIAGQLSHPSIVTIYDVSEDQDLTYMAMEYLEGNDLSKFISKGALLPFRKILDVITSVADALDYAHQSKVVHRDIKPANIMLLKNGGVKVTDFGIAKAISSSRTKTGVILGTPNYMSPEQIMGQKVDLKSDIFSLGVLFFQLLTGRTPFQGESLSNLLYQITQVKHPSLQTFNPKIPAVCERIIDKALAKNPSDRFQSAAEMAKYTRLLATKIDQLKKAESKKN